MPPLACVTARWPLGSTKNGDPPAGQIKEKPNFTQTHPARRDVWTRFQNARRDRLAQPADEDRKDFLRLS
eukprot:12761798-Alexandrium_andersonii.AAC.1